MNKKLKLLLLQSIVANNLCDLEVFCENVLSTDGKEVFTEKFNACKNREDIENLVNEYI
jgi:hypothetical protein